MESKLPIGIIGLGVMGQRMLARLTEHPRLEAAAVWDASEAAISQTRTLYPKMNVCGDAAAVIATKGLRCLYIATPPIAHMTLTHAAFDAGLAVLCEKPLTVDFAAGREAIARIAREQRSAAVNFSLASSRGLAMVCKALKDGSIGTPQRIEIEASFTKWPRAWQAAAGAWLAERAEGGFTREVLSHFVFVLQRAASTAAVEDSKVDYPADGKGSETAIAAQLKAGGLRVSVGGHVGGDQADTNRFTLTGSKGAIEMHDWFGLRRRSGEGAWTPVHSPQENREIGQAAQIEQLVALIEGRTHTLPSFAEALAVQETIEAMLRA